MQAAQVFVQAVDVRAGRLELLDDAFRAIHAVDAPPHRERDAVFMHRRGDRDFTLMALRAFALRPALRRDALGGGGRALVAIVDVAPAMHIGGQLAHADGDGRRLGGGRHRNRSTRAGSPTPCSRSSQRRWDSRSWSLGPFTSTNS